MDFRPRRGALEALAQSAEVRRALDKEAIGVRDRARRSAASISPRLTDGIVAEPASDGPDGPEARVGYDRHHEGFVLFFHEVGTVNHPARPHLRPAVRGRSAR